MELKKIVLGLNLKTSASPISLLYKVIGKRNQPVMFASKKMAVMALRDKSEQSIARKSKVENLDINGRTKRINIFKMFVFTARKRSCGKVMFLQASVILSTGVRGMRGFRGDFA